MTFWLGAERFDVLHWRVTSIGALEFVKRLAAALPFGAHADLWIVLGFVANRFSI